jgi:hypothetical protein
VCWWYVAAFCRGQLPEPRLNDLIGEWRKERWEKIDAAEFHVEYLRIQDAGDKNIPISRMHDFLAKAEIIWQTSSDPKEIRQFSETLPIAKKAFPNSWLSGRIVLRGNEIRNTFTADLVAGAFPEAHDICFSGGVDVFFVHESQQASLFNERSRWAQFGLDSICIPPPSSPGIILKGHTKQVVKIQDGDCMYEIDRSSGGVRWARYSDDGTIYKERWQTGFSVHEGGDGSKLTFPSISASIEYVDGFVTNCFLFINKSTRFNHELPADAFRVAVPAGTNVVLYPHAEQRNSVAAIAVSDDVKNVLEILPRLKEIAARRPSPQSPKLIPLGWWFSGVLGVIFLVSVVYFLRRKFRKG